MIKRTLLLTTLSAFCATAAVAGGDAPAPRMSVEDIETYSSQNSNGGALDGAVLPLFLLIVLLIGVTGSNSPAPAAAPIPG